MNTNRHSSLGCSSERARSMSSSIDCRIGKGCICTADRTLGNRKHRRSRIFVDNDIPNRQGWDLIVICNCHRGDWRVANNHSIYRIREYRIEGFTLFIDQIPTDRDIEILKGV